MNPQEDMVGTTALTKRDTIDEAKLTAWMHDNVDGFSGPLALSKFKGGQSNPTYKIDTATRSYVLRRKPMGNLLPSAHAVDREFKIISGLYPSGFPVAQPFGLCDDDDVIGSMFYVMDMVSGESLWDGTLPGKSNKERTIIYNNMIDTMAALHTVDYEAAGLSDFGKPADYCARQIHRWSKQYKLSETENIAQMDRMIEWLPQNIPAQKYNSIAHGDYRLDNLIFAQDGNVLAVLDWELSTLGDPMADFTYFLMSWVMVPEGRSGLLGVDVESLGIPTMEQAIARYSEKTGFGELADINWYLAYNLFRIAAILQGIRKRVEEGTANSPQAAEMSKRVLPLVEAAWAQALKAGATA